ncbi:hypothetical protein [Sphingomonas mali]|uniref:hypothetical protein n=1 Tax=Sphingomonas mali TaxID=40682 RepID=UPI00082CC278|nr:hypothetical protein [Sphingomonas mali]
MGRILFAIGFWALAIWLASSQYGLGVAIPLSILLGALGLKFFAAGVTVRVFLIIVSIFWGLITISTLVEGVRLFRRDLLDQASRQWTISVSLIGLAITFVVAIQSAERNWEHYRQGIAIAKTTAR